MAAAADMSPAVRDGAGFVLWLLLEVLVLLCKCLRGEDTRALLGDGRERVWSSGEVGVSAAMVTTVVFA